MIKGLSDGDNLQKSLLSPTIVMEAGIASEDNVKWLKSHHYRYIVVSRKKKVEIPPDIKMVPVKQDEKTKAILVQAGLVSNKETDEMELYCHSVDKEKKEKKASGVYCLRTNQKDLNEKEIWDIYAMLTDIEDAFRCMKSELGLRPNSHHPERRSDGHIFITLVAYHIMQTIRIKLRGKGIHFC